MSIRSTAVLCLVAVLAVVAALLTERFGGGAGPGGAGARRRLLGERTLPIDAIERITIEREQAAPMVFAREASTGRWDPTAPIAHPTDAHSMRQFVLLVDGLMAVDELDGANGPVPLAALGLEPPRATLRLAWPDGAVTLRLGRRGLGGLAYLQLDDRAAVYVVNQDLHARASDMDPREWRDRTIFRDVGVDSDRVEIRNGEHEIVLVRDRRQWRMERPVSTRLDDFARDELLQALGRARVGGFVLETPDDLASFGLDRPLASLAITTTKLGEDAAGIKRTARIQRLLVGSRMGVGAPERFGLVEGRDVVVRLDEPVLRALFPTADALVATTASGAAAADVWSIRIASPGGSEVELRRSIDDRWTVPGNGDGKGDAEAPRDRVQSLLATLTQARAMAIEIGTFPRELEVATITMFRQDGRPRDTVRVARTGDGRWMLENGDGVLRLFPASLAIYVEPDDFGLQRGAAPGR